METHNFESTEDRSTLREISRKKMVVGAKQLRKALKAGTARQVYLAENADPAITEPIAAMCRENQVPFLSSYPARCLPDPSPTYKRRYPVP
mgnify:CR=1 FL=1